MPAAALKPGATVADLFERLGDVPPHRVLLFPAPGTATEKDVLKLLEAANKRLCELVDGVLVEKTMGVKEAFLASLIVHYIWLFLEKHDLGIVLGADGAMRLMPGLVRIPDVSFISWDRLPGKVLPDKPIPDLAPNLAVEVISVGNTEKEMERKLQDYFDTDVQLVWLVYPRLKAVDVYTAPTDPRRVTKVLDGGNVLPGFRLPLKKLFART